MADFRNPADLLGIDRSPALMRLLRACGAEEACIGGGASDLDKFLALSEIMPLCPEHVLAERVNRTLREDTGSALALCPHTARTIWKVWVDIHWYGREPEATDLPAKCPLCGLREPTVVDVAQLSRLPDPLTVGGADLDSWTRAWEAALEERDAYPAFTLSDTFHFRRPDPYHAGEVIRKLAQGNPVTADEADLLTAQALRVWGQWHLRAKKLEALLLLCGGDPEAVRALLAYLQSSRALSSLVWIPTEPAQAETLSGLYVSVGTGVDLSACQSPEQRESRARSYRRIAPWGRATVLDKQNFE